MAAAKSLLVLSIAVVVSVAVWAGSMTLNKDKVVETYDLRTRAVEEPKAVPSPTLAVNKDKWVKEIRSGDGSMKLVGAGVEQSDGSTQYTFRVFNMNSSEDWTLFTKVVPAGVTMDIPYNSWSPNNKQLFIEEKTLVGSKYYVFNADGAPYKDGLEFLDVSEYWTKANNGYDIKTITGWGGIDLLVVRAANGKPDDIHSFWFVTSTRGVMRLVDRG